MQMCRLTNQFGVAEACKLDPLLEHPITFTNPVICVIAAVGFVICLDRTHAAAQAGYTIVKGKLEYAVFFFAVAVWYIFTVLDHSFYFMPSRTATWFVIGDMWSSASASLSLVLAALAESGRVGTVSCMTIRSRIIILAVVHAVHALIYAICGLADSGFMFLRVFWAIVLSAGLIIYSVLLVLKIAMAPGVRMIILLTLVALALIASVLVFFVHGVELCEKITPYFGGEHIALILFTIAMWAFYYFYDRLKEAEVDHLKEVRLKDGDVVKAYMVDKNK